MQIVRCQAFASACAFVDTVWLAYRSSAHLPQLGFLTTARLAKYDGRAAIPPLFCSPFMRHDSARRILLAIIHAAGIFLTAILIDIVLAASYLLSSTPPASSR